MLYERNAYLISDKNYPTDFFGEFQWKTDKIHIYLLDRHKNIYSNDVITLINTDVPWTCQRSETPDCVIYYIFNKQYADIMYPNITFMHNDEVDTPILVITSRDTPESKDKSDPVKNFYEIFKNSTDFMLIGKEFLLTYTIYRDQLVNGIRIKIPKN